MNPYEGEEQRRRNEENLIRVTDEISKAGRKRGGRFSESLKRLPIVNLVMGGLIICACFIGLALSERVSGVRTDVGHLKGQLKDEITALETKLTQTSTENEKLKNELAQIKNELESIKAENQKRFAAQQARPAKKAIPTKKQKR